MEEASELVSHRMKCVAGKASISANLVELYEIDPTNQTHSAPNTSRCTEAEASVSTYILW
jgi:hypothetical protein